MIYRINFTPINVAYLDRFLSGNYRIFQDFVHKSFLRFVCLLSHYFDQFIDPNFQSALPLFSLELFVPVLHVHIMCNTSGNIAPGPFALTMLVSMMAINVLAPRPSI